MAGTATVIRLVVIVLLVSVLMVALASALVPVSDRRARYLAVVLFTLLSIVLPLIGALLSLVYALSLRSVAHRIHEADVEPIHLPPPARDFRLRPSKMNPGAIAARLQNSRDSAQRVEALSQIMSARSIEPLRLLRGALRDEAEEVRLLAYAALDRREQDNTEMLIALRKKIAETPSGPLSRRLTEYLAWLRWNIDHSVSRELAEPAVHLEQFSASLPLAETDVREEDPPLLLGLQALENGMPGQALEHFDRARELGVEGSVLAPRRAAAHYLRRDLRALRAEYEAYPEILLSPRYGPSFRFWQTRGG
jgi:hypothetical protein